MTEQDNILRLTREAGFGSILEADSDLPRTWVGAEPDRLRRFAALVKAKAVVETREACAKVCMDKAHQMEREAQSALAEEDEETCGSNRATAWMLSVCSREILVMGATPSREGEKPGENHE